MVLCPAGVVDLTPFEFLNRLADLVPLNPKVTCPLQSPNRSTDTLTPLAS